jgi:hypothetical protein
MSRPASSPPPPTNYLKIMVSYLKELEKKFIRQKNEISEERRNALLVIASLLMTITYQGILNPHGGLWQYDFYPKGTLYNIIYIYIYMLCYVYIYIAS